MNARWLIGIALLPLATATAQSRPMVEWPTYGGDAGGMKYSPLADIDRTNVSRLARAWSWDTKDPANPPADSGSPARPVPGSCSAWRPR